MPIESNSSIAGHVVSPLCGRESRWDAGTYVFAFRPRLEGLATEVAGKKPTVDMTGTLQSVTECSHVVL